MNPTPPPLPTAAQMLNAGMPPAVVLEIIARRYADHYRRLISFKRAA